MVGVAQPLGITIDKNDHVYVTIAYSGDPNVYMFATTGTVLRHFGPVDAQGVGVDNLGNVYAADVVNTGIVKYGPSGVLLTTWGICNTGSGQLQCRDVAIGTNGGIYVVNSECNTVQLFGSPATPVYGATWGHLKSLYR